MEKHNTFLKGNTKFLIAAISAWIASVILSVMPFSGTAWNQEAVEQEIVLSVSEYRIGANIWLLQTIHGENGIRYRYAVETDCPNWNFQTRYGTDKPIDWVDETSAVEVVIHDLQVRYNGTVYASGQYYSVPILGGISSENISEDEWEEMLQNQAVQTIKTELSKGPKQYRTAVRILVIGIPIITALVLLVSYWMGKMEKPDDDIANDSL